MTWQVRLALRGQLKQFMDAELKAGKQSVTSVIRRRTTALKNNIRRQMRRSSISDRLQKTVRGDTYPKRGASLNARGQVYSKALYKRPGGMVDLITILDQGTEIRARNGKWLAIPIPDVVGKGRGYRNEPVSKSTQKFPPGTFAFVRQSAEKALLVFKKGPRKGEAAFVLVRRVRQKGRINIDKSYRKAIQGIDDLIVKTWERRSEANARKFGVDR